MRPLSDGNSFGFEGANSTRNSVMLFFSALSIPNYLRLRMPQQKSGSIGLPTEARFFEPPFLAKYSFGVWLGIPSAL